MAKLLEGPVIDIEQPDDRDAKIRRLESELRAADLKTQQAQNDLETARAAIHTLRQQLSPLHRALKAVFGEIEMAIGDEPERAEGSTGSQPPAANDRIAAVWQEWKQKLGGAAAKIITALLSHESADTTQLMILIGTPRRQTVHDAVFKLNNAGLINKNGGRISLKQL